MAAETTRAADALPPANSQVATSNVRHSQHVEKKSKLTSGAIVPVGLATAAVIGGLVLAVTGDDGTADSPG
ncbi:hypothetical protein [Stakelama marina]|uniref:Uncharacterized protein n=1 Tax=Stakelama marina TaxID=2826939 RepID=A0A8T4IH96_9SPHN|nr:hypothetical protein [Stakelama marina]MBR0553930.1 hypothetical protein [Stakelama marina]